MARRARHCPREHVALNFRKGALESAGGHRARLRPLARALWIDLAVVGAVVGAAWGHAGAAFALLLATRNVLVFTQKLEAATKVEPSSMRMGVTAVALVMAVHWMSCCWVMLSTPPAAGQYAWWELWSNAQAPADAISADGIGVVYLWALYFTISIITTAGFGDLRVANEHEACFMALILVISIVLQGSLVANMSTLILSSDSTRATCTSIRRRR